MSVPTQIKALLLVGADFVGLQTPALLISPAIQPDVFEVLQHALQQQESGIPAASCKPDKLVPPDQLEIEKHAALKQNCGWPLS